MGILDAPGYSRSQADGQFARIGAAVRPVIPVTPPSTFGLAGGAGTLLGTRSASTLTDTSDVGVGSQSVVITSAGAGAYMGHQLSGLTWDASSKYIRVVFKIDDYTNLNELYVYCGDSTLTNSYRAWIAQPGATTTQRVYREGEWIVADIPRGDFSVAAGAPSWASVAIVRVFATDKNNGGTLTVRIGGYGLVPEPAALPSGAVVFTLDDSDVSHFTIAKPYLDKYGAPGVEFPICSNVGAGGLTVAQLKTMRDLSGWEIGLHAWDNTEHSAGYAGLTDTQLRSNFDRLKTWAATNGLASDSYAWPNGWSDVTAETAARAYFSNARGTANGTQPTTFPKPMRVMSWGMQGQSVAQLQSRIDQAKNGKGVCVFLAHRLVTASPTGTDVLDTSWKAAVDYAVAQGVPIMTMTGVLKKLGLV